MRFVDPLGLFEKDDDSTGMGGFLEQEYSGDQSYSGAGATDALSMVAGTKGIHTDYDLNGNKYIHHEESDLRFNKDGDIVEHNGRVVGPATGSAAKILEYLKNVRPKFFFDTPEVFVIPPDWQRIFNPAPGSEQS